MPTITSEYVKNLPEIYSDILRSFFMFNPRRHVGERVTVQSLYSVLRDKHNLSQIRTACRKMEEAGVVRISDEIFVEPTKLGALLIDRLEQPDPELVAVPEFPPLEQVE